MSGPVVRAVGRCICDGTVDHAWRGYIEVDALRNAHYENSLVKFNDEQIMRGNRNAVTEREKGNGSMARSTQAGSPAAPAAAFDRRQSTGSSTAPFAEFVSRGS